ncbi:Cystatin-like cysteine protease inhibitor EPIC4 [Phytophthora ramorum]|uniref:Cystatin-like cysteine protease inhibitor EPIC4 n=1 Tax=Phytophthora ramorum TaxID=164328 RepID=UPI0030957429|nr:Cystatin-like cysteine protease inhibitor EPIC4 [Phytophthora ramorum]
MMHAALTFLVAFPALAAARNVVTIGMTGGWHEANVTAVNTQLLADALSGSSFSKAVGDTRVCYSEVASVETQVVAGTNYRFHIDGCSVTDSDGECSDATLAACKPSEFEVKIFEQPWTSTLKVTGIKEVEQAASSAASESGSGSAGEEQKALQTTQTSEESVAELKAAGLSEDEKEAVDEWIGTNGLNQYGDEATRMYVGGTPLFDESTGATTDRYDYILSRHSDRPWQETANFFAAEVDETQGRGTVAGVLAMLGVFTVVLAAVAVLKMHQGRRERFRYNPIHSREQ